MPTPDIKAALTRKVGPLPVVAWAGIAIAAFIAYRLLTGGGKSSGQVTVVDAFDPDAIDYDGNGSTIGSGVIPTPEIPPIGSVTPGSGLETRADGSVWWCPSTIPGGRQLSIPCRMITGPTNGGVLDSLRTRPVSGSGGRTMAAAGESYAVPLRLGSAPTIGGRTLASTSGAIETASSTQRLGSALRTASTTIRTATDRAISRVA
jgi:hypothetical protein